MNPAPDGPGGAPGRPARDARGLLSRIAREPLTHFLAIGAVIFVSAAVVRQAQRPVVRIDADELNQLASYWEQQMQRPPSKDELRGIINERVDEEILAQEARRQGLDKDDIIIRRRLAQKMAFASEDTAPIPEPDDATLQALYARTSGVYATPERLAMRQVYFSANRGVEPARQAALAALGRLKAGAADVAGDPFVMPLTYADIALTDLGRDYGDDYARAAAAAPPGAWLGPVRSAYGWHLLRVESRIASAQPPFATVRAQLREAWFADQRRLANGSAMDRLRRRYRVEIAGAVGGEAAHPAPGATPQRDGD